MDLPRALLWDVDGTLAETERDGHLPAFNRAFAELGLPWRWDQALYGELLHVTGGRERLLHDMATRADAPAEPAAREALARELHALKNRHYAALVQAGGLPLRPGVRALMDECWAQGVPMGIVTTTSRSNVQALLGCHLGPDWEQRFAVVVCGEDVERKKPDPQAYALALQMLGLTPGEAVALEDSPAGVAAARAAGVPVLLTPSAYFPDSGLAGVLARGPGLQHRNGWQPCLAEAGGDGGVHLDDIRAWCRLQPPAPAAGVKEVCSPSP